MKSLTVKGLKPFLHQEMNIRSYLRMSIHSHTVTLISFNSIRAVFTTSTPELIELGLSEDDEALPPPHLPLLRVARLSAIWACYRQCSLFLKASCFREPERSSSTLCCQLCAVSSSRGWRSRTSTGRAKGVHPRWNLTVLVYRQKTKNLKQLWQETYTREVYRCGSP